MGLIIGATVGAGAQIGEHRVIVREGRRLEIDGVLQSPEPYGTVFVLSPGITVKLEVRTTRGGNKPRSLFIVAPVDVKVHRIRRTTRRGANADA